MGLESAQVLTLSGLSEAISSVTESGRGLGWGQRTGEDRGDGRRMGETGLSQIMGEDLTRDGTFTPDEVGNLENETDGIGVGIGSDSKRNE